MNKTLLYYFRNERATIYANMKNGKHSYFLTSSMRHPN